VPIRHAVSLETDNREAKHTRLAYRITTSPALLRALRSTMLGLEVASRRTAARQRLGDDGTGAVAHSGT
jgi:hypothetical protein